MRTPVFLLMFTAAAFLNAAETRRVTFEGAVSEHRWTLKETGLPSDWSGYEFLVLELRASSAQRFEFKIYTADGLRRMRIHPFPGAWIRASVPLKYFLAPDREGHDLASIGNKPRVSYWMNIGGPFGPLNAVEAIAVAMERPIGKPTLELLSASLARESPGDAVIEPKPLVDEFGQWIHAEWPGKARTIDDLRRDWDREAKALRAGGFNYCRYGGYLNTEAKATGFFRVEQVDGKWWFVDPDGHLFFSIGADCMRPYSETRVEGRKDLFAALPPPELRARPPFVSFYTWNLLRRFGPDWEAKWIDFSVRRMDAWGLNTIANWSDSKIIDSGRKPYVLPLGRWGTGPTYLGLPDVYSPEFALQVDKAAASQCAPRKNDPYLIGYFIANEPPWAHRESVVADAILEGPQTAIQRELKAFLAGGDTPERRKEFIYRAFDRYIQTISAAIKKHDPNHLNLGIRFGGSTPDEMIRVMRVCDVYSLNIYSYAPDPADLERAHRLSGRPLLIGEFHFGTPGRGLAPGLRQTRNQRERATAYSYYVENAAAMPAMIGAHWFQYVDEPSTGRMDGENYNIGLVDVTDRPYRELVEAVQATNRRLFEVHSGKLPPTGRKAEVQ